jgi:hypothetical protein
MNATVIPNATPAQRTTIISLLRAAELDARRITMMHTRMPHTPRHLLDATVDSWLSQLSVAQASEVIAWLKEAVS